MEYGIDYHGNDVEVLHDITLEHWSDCAKRCLDHSACSYWTFKVAENICALKNSDAGWEKQDNTMSGPSDCVTECHNRPGRFTGNSEGTSRISK